MAFIFGIIRGCSKAATGSARSSFATAMTLVNFFGKLLAIVFTILEGVFKDKSSIASQTFAIVSMSLSVFVEIFFVVYTYRAYSKAKKHFEIAHAN